MDQRKIKGISRKYHFNFEQLEEWTENILYRYSKKLDTQVFQNIRRIFP